MAKKIQNPFNPIFSWYIKKRLHQIDLFIKYPFEVQEETLFKLLKYASNTEIGLKHNFSSIKSIKDYKNRVPISHYEDIEPTIQKIKKGQQNLVWPSEIKWFAKSSGTSTGKSKYIPVSKEAIENCHYKGGKDLLALYYNTEHGVPRPVGTLGFGSGGAARVATQLGSTRLLSPPLCR